MMDSSFKNITFFSIHEATVDIHAIYHSESVVDVLGYEQEQILGLSPYDYCHPDDVQYFKKAIDECIQKQRIGAKICVRLRIEGGWVEIESIFNFCHNIFFLAHRLARKEKFQTDEKSTLQTDPKNRRQSRGGTALEFIHPLADPTEHILRTKPEPRVGMVLNRFSYFCYVQYCSDLVGYMFGISQKEILGNSFFNYVHEDDIDRLEEEITNIKVNNTFCIVTFTFISAYGNVSAQACFTATMDGIVAVIRPGNNEFLSHPCKYVACSNLLKEEQAKYFEDIPTQKVAEVKEEAN